MDKLHLDKHISRQFNQELEDLRNRVTSMGGIVEQQLGRAIKALVEQDSELGQAVIDEDATVNDLEIEIDEECSRIIARRQPAASDLRLLMATSKTVTDLERIGDEAEKIGKLAIKLAGVAPPQDGYTELESLGNHVRQMIRDSLDAFVRLDVHAALRVAREDDKVDREYESMLRQQISLMLEDTRNIRRTLDVVWAARALERIGDHARNIGEHVIYLVEGVNVRHATVEEMAQEIGGAEPQD